MISKNGALNNVVINGIRTDLPTHAADYELHTRKVYMTSDQTFTQSNTTMQNVTEMVFAVGANEIWAFTLMIIVDSGATPDLKWQFTVPSGGSLHGTAIQLDPAGANEIKATLAANPLDIVGTGAGLPRAVCVCIGEITNGSTAGNLQLQGAQNTSDASDSKLIAGSYLVLHQLA